ncbi:unnamed protein product [Hydatigera taeniaeformis]|uniref:Secreted protein n=1 Tax=Hydatigena taeniaeformis TaxID=6205 RepID=A0A0R3WZ12_HYDTA|nr:unnamed protein product [Hydatigera taeniaeformis]
MRSFVMHLSVLLSPEEVANPFTYGHAILALPGMRYLSFHAALRADLTCTGIACMRYVSRPIQMSLEGLFSPNMALDDTNNFERDLRDIDNFFCSLYGVQ